MKSSASQDKKSVGSKKKVSTSSKDKSLDKNKSGSSKKETGSSSQASADFEAGIVFSRYDKLGNGVITADEFRQLWRESKDGKTQPAAAPKISPIPERAPSFAAGQIFSQFDVDKDGKLDKTEFEKLAESLPDLISPLVSSGPSKGLPTEVVTGRLLTHYDETAGVAIPQASVEQHKALGNTVTPLLNSYRTRYDRLRSLLTSRLLPRREHLVQLRRQLENCSAEVAAARKAIERETLLDAEQILERLRASESMRQAAIRQQMLQLEQELEAIERVVLRVEVANEPSVLERTQSGVLLTSAAAGSMSAVESVRGPRAACMVELIQQFGDISSAIERLATKALTVQVEYPTTDFPKETAERLEIVKRCDLYTHALAVKDQMIWTLLQEQGKLEDALRGEKTLSGEYATEIADWAQMTQSLVSQSNEVVKERDILARRNEELMAVLRDNNIHYVLHPVNRNSEKQKTAE